MNFRVGFDPGDAVQLHRNWETILTGQKWTGGRFVPEFEQLWSDYVGVGAVAFSNWWGAALCALEYLALQPGDRVLCPSNTFMATPMVTECVRLASVFFVDCSRGDLCLSSDGLTASIAKYNPRAVWLVHIGGHLAFDVERIAAICRREGVALLEDCAHAHGASFRGSKAGTFGDAGIYSFHATKTISTGEGGMLVSANADLLAFAREFRDYGKPSYEVEGGNYRMCEFCAAIGCVQVPRLDEIVAWKNEYAIKHLDPGHPNRVRLPDGMVSGLYKYIVFDPIEKSTGKVYEQPCHRIMRHAGELPNTDWVAANHWCVPLWYRGAEL